MISNIPDIKDLGKIADNLTSTADEKDTHLTERLRIDLTSPFKLPHLIRPYITLGSWGIWAINILWVLVLASIAKSMDTFSVQLALYTLAATTANLATCVSWYFSSRRNEKIQAKNAEAIIIMEEIKIKEQIRKEKVAEKVSRKEARKAKRNQD